MLVTFKRIIVPSVVAFALLLATLAWHQGVFTAPATPKPCPKGCSVILIMMDTLSADHIKAYGYDRDTMPLTTAFFKQHDGIQFDDVTSAAPWTLPSFTSLYYSDIAPRISYHDLEHPENRLSLPSALRSQKIPIGGSMPQMNIFIEDGITRLFRRSELTFSIDPIAKAPEVLTRTASSSGPFFFILHSFAAHDPYHPENGFEQLFAKSDEYPTVTMDDLVQENQRTEANPEHDTIFRLRYDQGIAQADAHLAKFLESIPTTTLERSVVVLSADHGEAFGQHSKVWHANSLFQEELHVPLLMIVPGLPARHIAEPVSSLDIAPTILSLMKQSIPKSFTGSDLTPLLMGSSLGERTLIFAHGFPTFLSPSALKPHFKAPNNLKDAGVLDSFESVITPTQYGVRRGNQKLTATISNGRINLELYDLATDPGETNSLIKKPGDVPPSEILSELLKLIH